MNLTATSKRFIFSFFTFFLTLFYFTILYWFCHTSTWIRHGCTRVPNFSGSSQCTSPKHPESCIEHRLAIRFLYDIKIIFFNLTDMNSFLWSLTIYLLTIWCDLLTCFSQIIFGKIGQRKWKDMENCSTSTIIREM